MHSKTFCVASAVVTLFLTGCSTTPVTRAMSAPSVANECPREQIAHNEDMVWQLAAANMNDPEVLRQTADALFAVDYVQHNPLVANLDGREGFVEAMKRLTQQNIPARYPKPMVVLANCEFAAAMIRFKRPDPENPGSTYDSFWFDVWRIENGKFIEHWDQAIKGQNYNWEVVLPLNGFGQ